MSARKSSHRTIFLIVSSGSPLALIASSLRSTSKKPVCPMTRSLHPPMAHCRQRVRFAATWREEFFEVPLGQFVVTGEPVAVIRSPVAKAGGASQPVLYVEFRKDGVPVDPGPWWAARRFADDHAQNFPDSPRCGGRRGRDA